jgi:predicted AAA+ superfamily ATPase
MDEFKIEREEYLNWLTSWRERQIIKVVSGVRRCGKSTLFELYRDYLLADGVDVRQIHTLNFEDVALEELTHYKKLYDYITASLLPEKMNYIFLDEIQHVAQFEKAVDSLFLKKTATFTSLVPTRILCRGNSQRCCPEDTSN